MKPEQKALDRMTAIAEKNSARIDILLAGYMELTRLVGTTAGADVSKAEVSGIVAETMKKFTS